MKLTDEKFAEIGKACRAALDGNMVVGSFAAEMVGESYPFSKSMCDIVFKDHSDLELGKKFVAWSDGNAN